jgi:hypothetical protein
VFAVGGPQSETARRLTDFSSWAFDFDKASGVSNVIKANRATVQPILLAEFGVGLFDAKIEQFKNALGRLVFDGRFDFHAGFLVSIPARTFESEHSDFPAVAAETKFEALTAEAVTAVEEFVAFKAAGMDLSAKLQEASANRVSAGDPILLFAFDAVA